MALPDSFIQELLSKNDIESVASSYVAFKRRGRNLVGLCPFHGEKTASFNLYPETNSFYCFGCGAGGDVITFIKRIENLEYIDAIKFLGPERVEDAGKPAGERSGVPSADADLGGQPGSRPRVPRGAVPPGG